MQPESSRHDSNRPDCIKARNPKSDMSRPTLMVIHYFHFDLNNFMKTDVLKELARNAEEKHLQNEELGGIMGGLSEREIVFNPIIGGMDPIIPIPIVPIPNHLCGIKEVGGCPSNPSCKL